LRSERKLIRSFENLGFTPKEAIEIMSNPELTKANRLNDDTNNIIYDVRDTPEAPFVIWWNDLEKDHKYSSWTSNLQEVSQ
jgi:UDP-glucose:glycoprotein glucosyltransferase